MEKIKFNWLKYNTDKVTVHGYDKLYDKHFGDTRNTYTGTIVEIGNRLGSTLLWRDYFPNTNFIGCDITRQYLYDGNNYQFINFNQNIVSDHLKLPFDEIDVIIEDGPHEAKAQFTTIGTCLPRMKSNSWLIIEDLHCTVPGDPHYKRCSKGVDVVVNDLMYEWQKGVFNTYQAFDSNIIKDLNLKFYIETGKHSEILFIHKQ